MTADFEMKGDQNRRVWVAVAVDLRVLCRRVLNVDELVKVPAE